MTGQQTLPALPQNQSRRCVALADEIQQLIEGLLSG
jgi:hypothetical protein